MPGSSPREQKSSSPDSPASPPNPGEQIIEPDDVPEPGDSDSAVGTDTESSTASLTSNILHYRTLHGRTYHSESGNAQYWGSNDEAQNDTMDIAHHMFTLAQDGKLQFAPIDPKIKRALDVGCGTGMWAIDFADEHPGCEVIGTDVSPIQPSWVPPNLKFEMEDCTQDWTFAPDSFDYVYMRYLTGCIPDWTEQYKQAFKVLKPGGYLESFEASPRIQSDDDTVAPGSPLDKWGDIFDEAGRKSGRTFSVIEQGLQRKCMKEAGFVDLQEWNFKCPMNPWPKDPKLKEVGFYGEAFSTQDTEGFVLFVADMLGWSIEEVRVFIAHVRRDIRNRRIHPYFPLRVVWGRKPENETPA